jgi:hypothetical protein
MSNYLLHPLSERIFRDKEFFNRAQPDLDCLHCFGPIDLHPPVGTPVLVQDIKLGSAHAREREHLNHDTMHVHKLYCDLHCQLAVSTTQNLSNLMLAKVYGFGIRFLDIVAALPFWTLIEFGGPLTRQQFRQWKEERKLSQVHIISGNKDFDFSQIANREEAWNCAVLELSRLCPYFQFVFEPSNPFWFESLPANTRYCCWNCGHSLANIAPTTAVWEFNEETETASQCDGFFHATACKLSYIIRRNGQLTKLRVFWNKQFDSIFFYQRRTLDAQRAPARRLLKRFGGPLSIDEFLDPNQPFKCVYGPPIQDFEMTAALNDHGLYVIAENAQYSYEVLELMRSDGKMLQKSFQMNGDEYQNGTEYFAKKFHIVNSNVRFKLHYTIMVIPVQVHMKSNDEIMSRLIATQTEREKQRELQRRAIIEGTGAAVFAKALDPVFMSDDNNCAEDENKSLVTILEGVEDASL